MNIGELRKRLKEAEDVYLLVHLGEKKAILHRADPDKLLTAIGPFPSHEHACAKWLPEPVKAFRWDHDLSTLEFGPRTLVVGSGTCQLSWANTPEGVEA